MLATEKEIAFPLPISMSATQARWRLIMDG